ncbi:small GTP-binding protein [Histomonas meleagridis]|uniref:small GTP-binding protein n=1 Tax=Histomonas meleagridis TaxID=135588 RepID=UPI003559D781|nr:small GTP-binding protein [Histomonas meleagridis]KAH0802071.1 small GTP-binding protein [Histomonas meleagridis]
MSETKELKLVLIGNTFVGKTCIVKKAISGVFSEDANPTLGASYVSKVINVGKNEVRLQIWDTAGQERFRGMTPMYFRGAHVAMIVYSICDKESFDGIDSWVESLHENAESDILIFLVGNKDDLEDQRVISSERGQEKATSIGAYFYEVSSKTGNGIEDLFNDIPRVYFEKHEEKDITKDDNTVQLGGSSKKKGKKKRSKC